MSTPLFIHYGDCTVKECNAHTITAAMRNLTKHGYKKSHLSRITVTPHDCFSDLDQPVATIEGDTGTDYWRLTLASGKELEIFSGAEAMRAIKDAGGEA